MKLNELTIEEARKKLDNDEITSVELTKACLKQIEAVDLRVKACLEICAQKAIASAEEADKRIKNGEKGLLLGIPYLAKDNILTKGVTTTAGSKMLEEYIPPYSATIIKKLEQAGAVLLGKTNLDEFAHGSSTEYSIFGVTHNPWDLDKVPGGSSGGSAAAVASDMCLFALGTDTGGSVRHPASFCGVVGLKPTYGLCSRFGLVSMTSSTDVPGTLTKTVEDANIVLQVIAGKDKYDSTTLTTEPIKKIETKEKLTGIKIGIPKEYFVDGLNKEVENKVREAIFQLQELGAEIIDIELPHTKYGISVYCIITPSEVSSNLARYDGIRYGLDTKQDSLLNTYLKNRGEGFGKETKRRIMLGTYVLSAGYYDAFYLKAQKVRTKIIQDFDNAFKKVDVILTPTTPNTAFNIKGKKDPLSLYLEDILLAPSSLAGLPAISVPCGLVNILPCGLQLIGDKLSEEILFQIAGTYQKNIGFRKNKPILN